MKKLHLKLITSSVMLALVFTSSTQANQWDTLKRVGKTGALFLGGIVTERCVNGVLEIMEGTGTRACYLDRVFKTAPNTIQHEHCIRYFKSDANEKYQLDREECDITKE